MSENNKTIYLIGVKLENKEHYDRLMENHSGIGLIGLDFKRLFEGYPDDYPVLVQYQVDQNPFGFAFNMQLRKMVDDGYKVLIEKEK